MSVYIDVLGSKVIVREENIEPLVDALKDTYLDDADDLAAAENDPRAALDAIFRAADFTAVERSDTHVTYEWEPEGVYRGSDDDFFDNIAPFVEGHIDYTHDGEAERQLFEGGTRTTEAGKIVFPSSGRW